MKTPPHDPQHYALPHIQAMRGYVPGMQPEESGWVKLNTNENPYPPSPNVSASLRKVLEGDGSAFRLYPDPHSTSLRRAVAQHHELQQTQVIVGNGCDDILNLLMRAFCDAAHAAGMMEPSYSLYRVLSTIQHTAMRTVAFDRAMELDVAAIVASGARVFFLTNPNAPTGVPCAPEKIATLANAFPGIVVVDETYAPFAAANCVDLLPQFPNLVITRSFSKAYALAGMRVGYGLAHPAVIDILDRVRDSYNVDVLAQVAAIAAIKDVDYYAHIIAQSNRLRQHYAEMFVKYGWFVYPSAANFLFVEPLDASNQASADCAAGLYDYLLSQKILVRYFPKHALTQTFLRISVGNPQQMEQLFAAIERWRNQNNA